jgi:hypothetical protein
MVTNAKLFSARYDPATVSLDKGTLPATPPPEISAIKWVRFTKAFSVAPDLPERTVFVVGATFLPEFLDNLELIPEVA